MTDNNLKTKFCNQCESAKSVGDFYRDRTKKDGLRTICKNCYNGKTPNKTIEITTRTQLKSKIEENEKIEKTEETEETEEEIEENEKIEKTEEEIREEEKIEINKKYVELYANLDCQFIKLSQEIKNIKSTETAIDIILEMEKVMENSLKTIIEMRKIKLLLDKNTFYFDKTLNQDVFTDVIQNYAEKIGTKIYFKSDDFAKIGEKIKYTVKYENGKILNKREHEDMLKEYKIRIRKYVDKINLTKEEIKFMKLREPDEKSKKQIIYEKLGEKEKIDENQEIKINYPEKYFEMFYKKAKNKLNIYEITEKTAKEICTLAIKMIKKKKYHKIHETNFINAAYSYEKYSVEEKGDYPQSIYMCNLLRNIKKFNKIYEESDKDNPILFELKSENEYDSAEDYDKTESEYETEVSI